MEKTFYKDKILVTSFCRYGKNGWEVHILPSVHIGYDKYPRKNFGLSFQWLTFVFSIGYFQKPLT